MPSSSFTNNLRNNWVKLTLLSNDAASMTVNTFYNTFITKKKKKKTVGRANLKKKNRKNDRY